MNLLYSKFLNSFGGALVLLGKLSSEKGKEFYRNCWGLIALDLTLSNKAKLIKHA